jgi:hypothetical protein
LNQIQQIHSDLAALCGPWGPKSGRMGRVASESLCPEGFITVTLGIGWCFQKVHTHVISYLWYLLVVYIIYTYVCLLMW